MKLILFSGSHPRHLYVNSEIIKHFDEKLVIVMQREELVPSPPENLTTHDKKLFTKHFANRNKIEVDTYGHLNAEQVYKNCNTIFINPSELNSQKIAKKVKQFNADFCFIFGSNLILDPVIENLPQNKINLHLGLSPWYKGAATLYWPFYNLKPQYCGVTFHQISKQADGGEIIHQSVPVLKKGDTIHDVGAKCVIQAKDDIDKLISHLKIKKKFKGKIQNISGRNWQENEFHASQLRVIYDLFKDKIVDNYLSKTLDQKKPKLFSCLK